MSADLTVITYTVNRIAPAFQLNVARELRASLDAYGPVPIIAVSQGPNGLSRAVFDVLQPDVVIDVGDIQPSIVQVYRNLLAASELARTPFCASAEDDCLYTSDHWAHRPPIDTFSYNERRVVLTRRLSDDGRSRQAFYYARPRTQMAMGIFPRALMIETLREKFDRYPDPPLDTTIAKKAGFGEPGRYERNLHLTPRKLERFPWTTHPNVTVNHGGLMGRRAVRPDDATFDYVEPWGGASALWERICG